MVIFPFVVPFKVVMVTLMHSDVINLFLDQWERQSGVQTPKNNILFQSNAEYQSNDYKNFLLNGPEATDATLLFHQKSQQPDVKGSKTNCGMCMHN